VDVPVAILVDATDTLSDVVFKCLDQTIITDLLTVDAANINVGTDSIMDDKSSLENKTVKAAFKEILLAANAVLYIDDLTVRVTTRSESAALKQTFFGQGASDGIENIIDITKFRTGANRVKNFWTWKDTTLVQQDASSITTFGIRDKEINLDIITDNTKRNTILTNLKNEFRNEKTEFLLETILTYDLISRVFLDKVAVDYPTIVQSSDGEPIPVYDQSDVYGIARYPFENFSLTIPSTDEFKIISKDINTRDQTMVLGLRKVGT